MFSTQRIGVYRAGPVLACFWAAVMDPARTLAMEITLSDQGDLRCPSAIGVLCRFRAPSPIANDRRIWRQTRRAYLSHPSGLTIISDQH